MAALAHLTTNTSECSDLAPGVAGTCLSKESVFVLEEYLNVEDIGAYVKEAAGQYGCDTEKCVIQQLERRKPNRQLRRDLDLNYKQKGPRSTTALLSNIDIDATLTAWTRAFPRFTFTPFAMIDFDKHGHPLASLDLVRVSKKHECWACVLNTDVQSGPGEHWVCLFADFRGDTPIVEYFNSTGNPPPREVTAWLGTQQAKGVRTRIANRRAHQRYNTECGVYVLYYIRSRLEGQPVEYFTTHRVSDAEMVEFRKHLFAAD